MSLPSPDRHLEPDQVAAYVDGTLSPAERRRLDAHLVTCVRCRAEVGDVGAIVAGTEKARHAPPWMLPATAAAAAILLIATVPQLLRDSASPVHRASAVTATSGPRLIAPVGRVDSVGQMLWSAVPAADRYRLRLFDPSGTVLWEHQTTDTTTAVPPTIPLRRGTYYWRVDSHSGFDRWTPSDLVEFVL